MELKIQDNEIDIKEENLITEQQISEMIYNIDLILYEYKEQAASVDKRLKSRQSDMRIAIVLYAFFFL